MPRRKRRGFSREKDMIQVHNLTKMYGHVKAVDQISFSVEEGKITGFLGPNGAGKSTTMNMLTGYLTPTEGEISICGIDMLKNPEEAKKHIGYLPEIPPVYPDMTPVEYLAFVGELRGIRGSTLKRETERVMELTGITAMQNRLIRNLSKGYRQRTGFSCALLGDPEVIVLDEPTVGLDPEQIISIRELIRSLGRSHTVLLSSHILPEVSEVCDDVLVLYGGRLLAGDATNVLEKQVIGTDRYDMEIGSDPETARKALADIPGIRIVSWTEGETVKVLFEADADRDPRRDIFYALAEADCPILALTKKRASLEEVFLELVKTERDGGVQQ